MDKWSLVRLLEAKRQQDPLAAFTLIQMYEQIIAEFQPNDDPILYANTLNRLGNVYNDLPMGKRAANLERAITCFQEALRFWRPETAPLDYAMTQNNLGIAYAQLEAGDRAANLERAIACFQEALRFYTSEAAPLDYAMTQNNLGNVYANLPTGDRAANLSRAIACFQEALRFRTPETAPLDYASTQNNLGIAYKNLPTKDRAVNLSRAIACFQEALRFRTPETAPLDYAMTQHNLGNTYNELTAGDRTANLERAIACYQDALRFYTPETAPFAYASTQHNLGVACVELPSGDRAANLNRAIACFQEALRFWRPETAPFAYAMTQHSLGSVYRALPTGDRAANLNQAITCFQEALRFRTPEAAPRDYALTLNNLGNVYVELPTGDRSANLKQAIACYQEALRFRTPEAAPLDYAMTQHNLGNAYTKLLTGGRAANLARAITCYQEALRFRTPEAAPLHYAMTQHNLGGAFSELSTGDRAANLNRAIACYQEALRFRTPEAAPFDYATTQNGLGNAYKDLPTGDRAANLEQAIACFLEALLFCTPNIAPLGYATIQNNLGNVYSELSKGNRAANLAQAITCYQEALRFWTPETAPAECRTANRNLADLYFTQREWKAALDAYRLAMDAGERLYRAGLSTESKATEVAENVDLYQRAAFAAVRCEKAIEAPLILERGKTRLLAEALRLRVARPANVPDAVWMAFEHAGASVRATQSESIDSFSEEQDYVQTYASRQAAARDTNAALDTAIEQVREYAPEFLQEIDLPAIRALLPDEHTILLAFCITEQGSMSFVVDGHLDQDVQVIEVPTFTQSELRRLSRGWLEAYVHYLAERTQGAFDAWQQAITNTLAALGRQLLTPTLTSLPADLERIIFLPLAELFLLPLHAAPLSDNGQDLMCDRYQVSYVPSISVMADTRAKAVAVATPVLYVVINPEADPRLFFTPAEGVAIARLFAQSQADEGRAGTKQRVITMVHGRSYVHFSCHGSYNWNAPAESGLDLADGRLTLAELQRGVADLSGTRLVTLSACETGIVDVFQGNAEEYVGIPAGFLLAGVPCVVSSLWAVPDLSTALLMERFYRNHLKNGMDFAAALREAQVWMRNLAIGEVAQYAERCYQEAKVDERIALFQLKRYYQNQAEQNPALRPFAHPYYWAAFTVNGM